MEGMKLRGTGTALVTPFTDEGHIDYESLRKIIDHNIEGGVEFLVSLGTTGEAVTITQTDCQKIFDVTVEHVAGRVPVIFGVFGSNSTQVVLDRFSIYSTDGASAILSASPYYNKPSQDGIFLHYEKIAESSPLPVIIYNVPGRTACNVDAETTLRIAEELPNVIGIKEASGDVVQFEEILTNKPKDFKVWSGDDPTSMVTSLMGGDGVISVISNALPFEFSAMIRAALQGNTFEASHLNGLVSGLHKHLYRDGNPAGIKAALEYLGFCNDNLRLPLTSMKPDHKEALFTELSDVLSRSPFCDNYDLMG